MKLIQILKKEEKESSGSHTTSEKTLEYLCWVVNADVLYDFALKTYDFELVIMVAKYTQKDPKEYLPYLKKLQEMDPVQMKFNINYDLKFYEDAIFELSQVRKQIIQAQDKYFDQCLAVIEKHQLHEQSLKLFCKYENCFKKIWLSYGKLLESQSKLYEAGYAYLNSDHNEKAFECFRKNYNFSELVVVMRKLNLDFEVSKKVWNELIEGTLQVGEIEKLYHFLRNDLNNKMFQYLLPTFQKQFLKSKRWLLALNLVKI